MKRPAVHVVEYLSSVIDQVIDAYHEGSEPDPARAKRCIMEEVRTALRDFNEHDFRNTVWLRVACKEGTETVTLFDSLTSRRLTNILSVRKLGARPGSDTDVYYIVAKGSFEAVQTAVLVIESYKKYTVRDWNYGCAR